MFGITPPAERIPEVIFYVLIALGGAYLFVKGLKWYMER